MTEEGGRDEERCRPQFRTVRMYLTQPRSEKEHKEDEPGMEGEGDEGVLSRFREGWDGWDLMGRKGDRD